MTDDKVQELYFAYANMLSDEKKLMFKNALKKADDDKYDILIGIPVKNPTTTLLLSIFLGGLGVDRFYIGDTGLGVAKLLVGWLTFGIWPLIDIFCSFKKVKEKNFQALMLALS